MSEPQPRPAETSVGEVLPPREQSDDADMADPESDRRRPESRLERKEQQIESGSLCLMVMKVMNGWRPKRHGCEFTVVPDEICSLTTTLRVDLSYHFEETRVQFFAALLEENRGSLVDGKRQRERESRAQGDTGNT